MWEASPIFLAVILAEILISNFRRQKVYSWKETAVNFYLSILNGLIDLLIRGATVFVLIFFFDFRLFSIQTPLLYWIFLAIAMDFLLYWLHRLEHYCRLFWAVHVTHHSSELMNFTVAFRSSVFQPLYRFIFFIPLALFGFKAIDIMFLYSLTQFWAVFVHTEFINKLGWLEYIFVTPSHHRVHHASNHLYLDKNMGMFLIIWDRLFGTFQEELPAENYEKIRYGLTSPITPKNPFTLIFHEWISLVADLKRTDISWKIKLRYLLKPPGWSHDGTRKTSEELRSNLPLNPDQISTELVSRSSTP